MIPQQNQIGKVGYYHIPGKPGETVTLQARITNRTDKALEVKMVPLNAYSSNEGIFYQSPKEVDAKKYILVDERYGLAQYIKENPPLTLQTHQSEIVSVSLTVPNLVKGTLLGSIRFVVFAGTQEVKQSDAANKGSQLLIDKYQAMDTAVQIDLPQTADEPAVSFGNPTFNGDSANVNFDIINEGARIQDNISGSYEISDTTNNKLFDGTIKSFKMAPMTRFQYPVPWNNKTLEPGNYVFTLKTNVAGKDITSTKDVSIENKAVQIALDKQVEINPEIKPNRTTPIWIWIVIVLLVVIIILLFIRRKKSVAAVLTVETKVVERPVESKKEAINEAFNDEGAQSAPLSRLERHKKKR